MYLAPVSRVRITFASGGSQIPFIHACDGQRGPGEHEHQGQHQRARKALILSAAWPTARTPLRWPFGPASCAVSTGVPDAAMARAGASIGGGEKTRAVGVE